ncbi:MAG: DUF4367 domain-containing protein [Clostridia bacterium]|nr:DUF4367 domain-containing protein [Clostridia bacterium]
MIDDNIIEGYIGEARDLWLKRRETETAEHIFPEGFENKIRCAGGWKHRPATKVIASAVIAAVLVMTGVAGQLPVFEFAQNDLLDIGVSIYDESTDFSVSTDYVDNSEVKRPYFNWLPKGVVEEKRDNNTLSTFVRFKNENVELTVVVIKITHTSRNNSIVDTEDAESRLIEINGNKALMVKKNNWTVIDYFIKNYMVSLSGTLSTDDIVCIAENIVLK